MIMNTKFYHTILTAFLAIESMSASAQSWSLTGNSGINVNNNFLGTTDGKALVFRTKNIERLKIGPNGRIGIGTSAPDSRFNVAVANGVSLSTTDSFLLGEIKHANLAFDNDEIQARDNGLGATLYLNYWGGDLWLGNRSGNAIPAVYTTAGGQVAIGNTTTQAGFALTVNPFATGGAIYINDPGAGNIALCTKSGNTGEGMRMNISSITNPNAAIRGHTDGNGFGVLAEATGSIGFGAEDYSTHSYGLWAGTGNSSTYAGYFSGDVFTTGTYNTSDEKLKQNIADVSTAMDIIDRLHPKKYQFRQDGNYKLMNLPQGEHYGLIAQDVEKILPGIVKETTFFTAKADPTKEDQLKNAANIEFKALNYTELIPIIIKGMQEQQSIIDQQQQQINELKQMVQALAGQPSFSNSSTSNVNGAWLKQNSPNPFKEMTSINYFIPPSASHAQLSIFTTSGKLVTSYSLSSGMNSLSIANGTLAAGQYVYSLVIDGKRIDSRNMTVMK